jgi:RecA-family ATPase
MPLTTAEYEWEVFKALLSDPYNPEAKGILELEPSDWTRGNRKVAAYLTWALRERGSLDAGAFVELALDHEVDPQARGKILELIGLTQGIEYPLGRMIQNLRRLKGEYLARVKLDQAIKDPEADLREVVQQVGSILDQAAPGEVLKCIHPSEFLDYVPEEISWTVPMLIPQGVPGILASRGGLGKSWAVLQACIACAVGKSFLDFPEPKTPMTCFYFGVEDSREVLHRRIHAIVQHYRARGDWSPSDDELLRYNLKIPTIDWGKPGATAYLPDLWPELQRLLKAEKQTAHVIPGLVVFDTFSSMSRGDENTVDAVRPHMDVCLRVCDLGFTSLTCHHVAKGQDGARNHTRPTLGQRLSSEWLRGSSSLVDLHRLVLQLAPINEDDVAKASLDPDMAEAGNYCVLGQTKTNGTPYCSWRFLEQGLDGLWEVHEDSLAIINKLKGSRASRRAEIEDQFIEALQNEARKGPVNGVQIELLASRFSPDSKNKKIWFHTKIHRLRKLGKLPEDGYLFKEEN